MKRRKFIYTSSSSLFLSAITGIKFDHSYLLKNEDEFQQFLLSLIKINDASIERLIERQQSDPSKPHFGGIVDRYGMYSEGVNSSFLVRASCAASKTESKFYNASELISNLRLAANHLLTILAPYKTIYIPIIICP